MSQYFYAYHGPGNHSDFDPSDGYGVSQEYKQNQVNIGDLVYVIQKRRQRNYYELCGLYEITDTYFQETSKKPYRVRLAEVCQAAGRIAIDEEECSHRLPQIDGDVRWSNFQRHFCRQGVSFQSPLKPDVVSVLSALRLKQVHSGSEQLQDFSVIESEFSDEIDKAARDSSFERIRRLAKAKRKPRVVRAVITVFARNPDVVAEVLFRARGACGRCRQKAPFIRHSDGSPYLEVHHKIRLADGGEDTLDNAIALCPNCHRELHFGATVERR